MLYLLLVLWLKSGVISMLIHDVFSKKWNCIIILKPTKLIHIMYKISCDRSITDQSNKISNTGIENIVLLNVNQYKYWYAVVRVIYNAKSMILIWAEIILNRPWTINSHTMVCLTWFYVIKLPVFKNNGWYSIWDKEKDNY